MNSRQLMKSAMCRNPTERIPTMPQICYDLPVRVNAKEEGTDWKEGYQICAEQPEKVYDYVIDIVRRLGCDGLRLFLSSDSQKVVIENEQLIAIDAFYIGDPSASASLISPKHFEQFCLPAYQKFCSHFKKSDILIYIHICGNSNPILEMMAETGADVIEPLDPLGGVKVDEAKSRVGNRVALMGGVNILTLSDGSVDDVINEAVLKCRQGGPYGYVLASGDMVPPNTPFENIKALVDVAVKSLWK